MTDQDDFTVTIAKRGMWFIVSDQDGEFARASTPELTLPYVADLLHGPGTKLPANVRRLLREGIRAD